MDAAVVRPAPAGAVGSAFVILAIVVATIAGAWGIQAAGYAPCELCLKERLPYYAAIVLTAVTIPIAWRGPAAARRTCFAVLTLLFLFSAGLGVYHAGVEWGFWPGPSDCTGTPHPAASSADFLRQLQTIKVVRCDAVAIRILGLSLAGWNAIVSAALAAIAFLGTVRRA